MWLDHRIDVDDRAGVIARTEDPRSPADLFERLAGSADARAYVAQYARLIEQNPSTPQRVRDRIGVLIRRIADPEPPIVRILPEVGAALIAGTVTAGLVGLDWIEPAPVHLFVTFCLTVLVAHPVVLRSYRRWIDRRLAATAGELELLLPS